MLAKSGTGGNNQLFTPGACVHKHYSFYNMHLLTFLTSEELNLTSVILVNPLQFDVVIIVT